MLRPMSEEAFGRFVAEAVASYAMSNVKSGRWPEEGALAKSEAEFERHLSEGLSTPDHHFLEVLCSQSGATVGHVWWGVSERSGVREAFIFDLQIREAHRRQGHAKRALEEVESVIRSLGLSRIGLHVFAYNTEAQALYQLLGFGVTSLNMHKEVSGAEPNPSFKRDALKRAP